MVFALLYGVARDWLRRYQQQAQLQQAKLKADIAQLRSQINPHFFFNSLNNIYAITQRNNDVKGGLAIMQLADLLRSKSIQVIFCTAYSEYAVKSYELEAVDYLLKPIAFDRFLKAAEKVKELTSVPPTISDRESESKTIFIKSGATVNQVTLDQILYVRKDGHYVEFHTGQEQLLWRMNMDELLAALPSDKFVRVHKSYVVAVGHISKIEKQFVTIGNREIPIGDHYRPDFYRRIDRQGN